MVDDPLAKLLLDSEEVDRASLARALHDFVGIDSRTGKVVLKPGFNKLTSRKKVLAYLLGKKVAKLLGKIDNELTSPKDIPLGTGIPKGTVNPKLRELSDARLVSQTKEGEYFIESHQILKCVAELENKEEQ
jgi:hypothetical protein